jgi:predicted aldo/keto reductase-like oxidoreductase
MNYRKFGKLDWQCSALGFGCMRFPSDPEGDYDHPLVDEAIHLVRTAIDRGVNYVDTAFPYHAEKSEVILGQALQNGYRDKVKVATKMPCWLIETPDDFDKYLDIQLQRLQTDHIDFYLLHGLWKERWQDMKEKKVFTWAEKAMADGRISHLGFSFHDEYPLLKEVVDYYDNWTVCQIQYNYLNEEVQAGTEGLQYAAQKGLAVVIMEPLLGGYLANPPAHIGPIWDDAKQNPVDLALRWLWNKPEVATVLSGMRSMDDLEKNLSSADNSGIETLSKGEQDIIIKVREEYEKLSHIPCTKCRYCMPCPHGVNIPRNFELYNGSLINPYLNKALYTGNIREVERAKSCTGCRACEKKCPQHIKISEWMPRVDKFFEEFQ